MNKSSNRDTFTEEVKREHRALIVLKLLEREFSAKSNEHIVSSVLDNFGLVSSRDQIRNCFNQLEASGLIVQQEVERVFVIELTANGREVAQGRTKAEGVLQPFPECGY